MTSNLSSLQQNATNRFAFIDGLRGIAVVAVTLFHYYRGGPFYETLSQLLPKPLDIGLAHGWLGVEIFFVISGFVIAHSLREVQVNFRSIRHFMICRYLRLAPPYLVSIGLIVGLNYFSNFILADRLAPLFDWQTLIIHSFYLQNLLQTSEISPVFWTLCLEVYFYLVFICLLGFIQAIHRFVTLQTINLYAATFLILSFISLASSVALRDLDRHSLFTNGYIFIAGILIYWVMERRIRYGWLWAFFSIVTGFALVRPEYLGIAATLIIGLLLWQASRSGNLHCWLAERWIQYFGKVSYSLYLLHTVVGSRVINLGYRVSPDHPLLIAFWFILAFALSLVAAHGLYVLVEKPSIRLSKQFKTRFA